ncbi:ABC transporter permease [Chungangia koreensis]|uniref:ABC transporter permease n=1 Tax=Chungangia koreensis TaxID=752657 RepID=A0ABV8X3D2_9LACT
MQAPTKQSLIEIAGEDIKRKNEFIRLVRKLWKSKTGMIGFVIVMLVTIVGIFANQLAPFDPNSINPIMINKPPFWMEGGTSEHILGTDNLGRDLLSRIIVGTQVSLIVGVCAIGIAGAIGLVLGLFAGYYGGLLDNFIMRGVDAVLAIPNILFMLVVLGVFGPGLWTLVFVIGATKWVTYARLVRGEVLSIKERDFVKASRTLGTKDGGIIFKHILPNVISSFIVVSTLSIATAILLEASLSYLGMGIQPPMISWGGILESGRDYLATSWWISTFPGIAITVTVLGIIFLGDWLRDVLDPRLQMEG